MKRWLPLAFVAGMLVTTAGVCAPPPPIGWEPPVVEEIVISPDPVVPGQPFTVRLVASDDNQVAGVRFYLHHPIGFEMFDNSAECEPVSIEPAPRVEVEATCSLPVWASNGTWRVFASVSDGEYSPVESSGTGGFAYFEVAGGDPDDEPPTLEWIRVEPEPAVAGQPFEISLRMTDERLIIPSSTRSITVYEAGPQPVRGWQCPETYRSATSGPEVEMTFSCTPPEWVTPGVYIARKFGLSDLNFNNRQVEFEFGVVAAG